MTYDQAIFFYRIGFESILLVVAGPFLVVLVVKWVKSILSL